MKLKDLHYSRDYLVKYGDNDFRRAAYIGVYPYSLTSANYLFHDGERFILKSVEEIERGDVCLDILFNRRKK